MIEPKVMEIFREFVDRLHGCGISATSNVDVDGTDKIFDTWRAIRLGESLQPMMNGWPLQDVKSMEDVIRMLEKDKK